MDKPISRRTFVNNMIIGSGTFFLANNLFSAGKTGHRPNFLFITVDDMNYDSLGVTGCRIPGITPNLDRLASEGIRFECAHVTIAVCQPCREVLMTGRYPDRNGGRGFEPINANVPTLQEQLNKAGYINGIMGKVTHLAPRNKFCWDFVVTVGQLGAGRSPEKYHKYAKEFFSRAKLKKKPFFLMANSHDPHRPFAKPVRKKRRNKNRVLPGASRYYKPEEVEVPGFLPDIPRVREEVAQYFTSVHRADETVGALLQALKESGFYNNTVVMFISDHGMAFPFAKTNCWKTSTHTPWMARWPGAIKPGTVDRDHFISGIDFMPTVLDIAGIPMVAGMDGRSFLPLLRGKQQSGRSWVYTVFHETAARRKYPMRSVQNKKYGYIFNPWSDGKKVFRNESQAGLTFKAMKKAAEKNPKISSRVKLFLYRVKEEFYDYENDPNALNNLINNPAYKKEIEKLKKIMLDTMIRINDPLLAEFRKQVK